MPFCHLYRFVMISKRKPKQPPQSGQAEVSPSGPHASATQSNHLVADNSRQVETAPPQATDESPSIQDPLPSNISSGKQLETANTLLPEVRCDQRRYGQIFHNPDVEAIGMRSSKDSSLATTPTESTKAIFPPLPPFRMRKRGCGGA
jgi:hypothetical protein